MVNVQKTLNLTAMSTNIFSEFNCSCPIYTAFSGIPPKAVIGLSIGSINRATCVVSSQADRELQLCHSERSPSALVTLSEAKGLGCLRVN
jgi:hypothetical protein